MKRNTGMVLLVSIVSVSLAHADSGSNKVIYGNDDRKDVYQVTDSLQLSLADSTVALIKKTDLVKVGTKYNVSAATFGSDFGMCSDEPYYNQPSGAFCSGSLVGPRIIITAGHCVVNLTECKNTKFVFNYAVKVAGQFPTQVNVADVVGCKRLIKRKQEDNGADFAVIELDRAVTDHQPLAINRSGDLQNGAAIGVIGHPSGLPTKVAFGASVRNYSPTGFFVANLDTYGGNSGSAVFNATTGKVEGILVRGEQDFIYSSSEGCRRSNICSATGCRGEDVTKITALEQYIP